MKTITVILSTFIFLSIALVIACNSAKSDTANSQEKHDCEVGRWAVNNAVNLVIWGYLMGETGGRPEARRQIYETNDGREIIHNYIGLQEWTSYDDTKLFTVIKEVVNTFVRGTNSSIISPWETYPAGYIINIHYSMPCNYNLTIVFMTDPIKDLDRHGRWLYGGSLLRRAGRGIILIVEEL